MNKTFDWKDYLIQNPVLLTKGIDNEEKVWEYYVKTNKITVINIFDHCSNDTEIDNCLLYIDNIYGNSLSLLCSKDNKILSYSNEWLSLIKVYYKNPYPDTYNNIIDVFNKIDNSNVININEEAILFCTSFSNGTVHGYAAIFYMISIYLEKYANTNFKIIVYKNTQKGMLDVIYHIIPPYKIIIVDNLITYKIRRLILIPNLYHTTYYDNDLSVKIIPHLLDNYFIMNNLCLYANNDKLILSNKHLPEYVKLDNGLKICIIKTNINNNATSCGSADYNKVKQYCLNNNYYFINPEDYTEIEVINIINRCSDLILSWGTTFFKNYVYVSEKCENINVLVVGDAFNAQYIQHLNSNSLVYKYKNAILNYEIDNSLL